MSSYNYNLGLFFYDVASSNAERTAIAYPEGKKYSYKSLNELSNQLARYLLSYNIRKNDVIALLNNKSIHAYALMLACLKTGIIYTNLDSSSPWERIRKILATSSPRIIFDDGAPQELTNQIRTESSITVTDINTEDFRKTISSFSENNLTETKDITGADPAYIMFTSGSTGFPKGAVMSHSNVINFIHWGQTIFSVTVNDIFTNVNPIYFDNSVFDFYTSVFSGTTLVPLSAEIVKEPKKLVQAINDSGCTIWFSVPSLLVYLLTTKALTNKDFPSIKNILFGGEGFPKTKLKQLYELFADRITLHNVYGPTECTCICSSYIINKEDFINMNELTTLGHLASNFTYEILPLDASDPDLGELCLIGPNVGLGYYNDEDRMKASFIPNPKKKYFERMYKSGDLVKRAENGYLYFKGRVDNQIKHMGYRIELEEVEAAFNSISYVNEVGVIYEKLNADLGQIKAFVSTSLDEKTSGDLMNEIKKILPAYMVPRTIEIMKVLPKNRNGKVDRKQLQEIKK